MSFRIRTGAALCALAVVVAACGGSGQQAGTTPSGAAQSSATAEPPPPLPGESSVKGHVTLTGTAPAARVIRAASSDPLCMTEGGALKSEVVVVGPNNQLQNVFLYVKDGLGDRTFQAPKAPVMLDQTGCRYSPHVFGVQVGQPVQVVNSDPTVHNVHAVAKSNAEFNFSQVSKGQKDVRTFDKPEIMVPFRCEVHGWMNSYAGVVPHPFFAVSGDDGSFEIKGLPQGTYTIEAWHETLGVQTQKVTVDGKTPATIDFTFEMKT